MHYLSVSEAIERPGLRLVLSPGLPGPWSVAAKAVFDLKRIPYEAVAQGLAVDDAALRGWTGQDSAPAAMFDNERPRTRWYEILALAERLAPQPSLVPDDDALRSDLFGLLHGLAGEGGFGWNFRLVVVPAWEAALRDPSAQGGFLDAEQIATMQRRYGDPSCSPDTARDRMARFLRLLAARLRASRSGYFVGDRLSAVDVYWTAFSNLVAPMGAEHCPMPDGYRTMGEATGRLMGDAVDPVLLEHRDRILVKHLRTPLQF